MSNGQAEGGIKLFPRNLTARADYLVKGNPVSTRPESGVGNTCPGLEFDERALDKFFFPGLTIEFQWSPTGRRPRDLPPLLREVDPDAFPALADINGTYEEVVGGGKDERDLVLVCRVKLNGGERIFDFFSLSPDILGPWRAIRDMPQGEVKVLLASIGTFGTADFKDAEDAFDDDSISSRVVRDPQPDAKLRWAVLTAQSRQMLDPDTGVIDTGIPAGELQSTMCTPWHYDFRDCRCYYWASNRPDLVSSGGIEGSLRFLRKERNKSSELDEPEIWESRVTEQGQPGYNEEEPTYIQLFNEWEQYPVVLNDREYSHLAIEVAQQFQHLARIEHALAVEYLYAYYSLNQSKPAARAAAKEVLSIAIDEMRHFRWVNEILQILGEQPVFGRIENFGRNFDDREFKLEPLTLEQLNWFIAVERPSRSIDMPGQIDGMYVRLHQAIAENPQDFPRSGRLHELIKLIIDEGEEHYQRFMRIEDHLASFLPGDAHLYTRTPPAGSQTDLWLKVSNLCYEAVISFLLLSIRQGDRADGRLLAKSVACMHAMDDFNKDIARFGHLRVRANGPIQPFELPVIASRPVGSDQAVLKALENSLVKVKNELDAQSDPGAEHMVLANACIKTIEDALNTD